MKYTNVFHLISNISDKTGVSCILIGGFAINYYKVTRQTVDVDFLITEENFKRILCLLEEKGYKLDFNKEVFVRLKSDNLYLIDIDFMFVDKETLTQIIKDGKEVSIVGKKFIVPSLNHLIALKLHSVKYNPDIRETKDIPDIINLVRINKVNVKNREFKELCLKYGTEEIYNKILDGIYGSRNGKT